MASHIQQNRLEVPPDAVSDKSAFEVLRVWQGVNGAIINAQGVHDAYAWGITLADVARSIAVNDPKYLHRLLEGFHAEIETPTK